MKIKTVCSLKQQNYTNTFKSIGMGNLFCHSYYNVYAMLITGNEYSNLTWGGNLDRLSTQNALENPTLLL